MLTYYGIDNQIDGIVLDVLIREHKKIRSSLGISVPVPIDTNQVVEAVFEGLLLRQHSPVTEEQLALFEDFFKPQKEALHNQWDVASEREKRSRTVFAQAAIKVDEVARELEAVRAAIGSGVDVAGFVKQAFRAHKGVVSENGAVTFNLSEAPKALKETVGVQDQLTAVFNLPAQDGQVYLNRTHPIVEGLASLENNRRGRRERGEKRGLLAVSVISAVPFSSFVASIGSWTIPM